MMKSFKSIIAVTLGLAATAFVHTQIKKDTLSGINEDAFYLEKTFSDPTACSIAAGDSRLMYGFIPPDKTWQNFGYPAAGWSDAYLDGVENRLAPQCKHKRILLGATHLSMTERSEKANRFLEVHKDSIWTHRIHALTAPITRYFDPIAIIDLRGGRDKYFSYEFYKNGWAKSDMTPRRPEIGIPFYKNRFRQTSTPKRIEERLLKRASKWIAAGIEVIAIRPPSSTEMRELEDEMSGHNTAEFAKKAQSVGIQWIDIPNSYETYDGSHLTSSAAKQFSADLMSQISDTAKSSL